MGFPTETLVIPNPEVAEAKRKARETGSVSELSGNRNVRAVLSFSASGCGIWQWIKFWSLLSGFRTD